MPGKSYQGTPPKMDKKTLRIKKRLKADVDRFSAFGEKTFRSSNALAETAEWIDLKWKAMGYEVHRQDNDIHNKTFENLYVEIPGSKPNAGVVVIGAHYDTVRDCPGADDNGSGVAALLELSRVVAGGATKFNRTIFFVAFTMEEYLFSTNHMGSAIFASSLKVKGEKVFAMISLETMGFFSDSKDSQSYPVPALDFVYPNKGNFIAFVGNIASRSIIRSAVGSFRKKALVPSEGIAAPGWIPGIGWSDHLSFWNEGYPGLMVTDTAMYRNPHYHKSTDTPDKLDYDRFTRVVVGLGQVINDFGGVSEK